MATIKELTSPNGWPASEDRKALGIETFAVPGPKIKFAWNSEVAELQGDAKLSGVTLRNINTGDTSQLSVTGLFVAIGHDPRSELLKGQVDLDPAGYVLTGAGTTATNLSGVFACGDLVDHTYRQAITAAGTGCSAALDAERFLSNLHSK
jgi:thioredoxin reductase (NADPH)